MNRKVFSLMMALAMVLTLLPAQSLAVGETRPEVQFVEDDEVDRAGLAAVELVTEGGILAYGKFTDYESGELPAARVTFGSDATLTLADMDDSGEDFDLFLAQVNLLFPEGKTDAGDAKYTYVNDWLGNGGQPLEGENPWVSNLQDVIINGTTADGRPYMTLNGGAQPEYFTDADCAAADGTVNRMYKFDWDGDKEFDEVVIVSVHESVKFDLETGVTAVLYGADGEAKMAYTRLPDAVGDAQNGETVKLFDDAHLTEKLTVYSGVTIDGNGHTIFGVEDNREVCIEVTREDNEEAPEYTATTFKNVTIKNFGNAVTTNSRIGAVKVPYGQDGVKLVVDSVKFEKFNRAALEIQAGAFEIKDCDIDCTSDADNKLTKGVRVEGTGAQTTGTISNTRIVNTQNTYSDWATNAIEIYYNAKVDITDCTLGENDAKVENGVALVGVNQFAPEGVTTGEVDVTVTDTNITADKRVVRLDPHDSDKSGTAKATIVSGLYSGTIRINQGQVEGAGCTVLVQGGFFTDAPDQQYLAEGQMVVPSTEHPGYGFTIGQGTPAVVVNPETIAAASESITDEAAKAIAEQLAGEAHVVDTPDVLTAAINTTTAAAEAEAVNEADYVDGMKELLNEEVTADDLIAVTQPVVNVVISDVKMVENKAAEVTFEITASYITVIARKADVEEENNAIMTGGNAPNAVQVGEAKLLTVDTPVAMTLTIPGDVAKTGESLNELMVEHLKGGKTYYYGGKVEEINTPDGAIYTLTFTTEHGFSPFTVKASDKRQITVTFDSDVAQATYAVTDVGMALPAAEKSGYNFNGWEFAGVSGTYKELTSELWHAIHEAKSNTDVSVETPVEIEAAAKFTAKPSGSSGGVTTRYTLTFETNGGSRLSAVRVIKGTTVKLDTYVPTREGWNFDGWYLDKALKDKVTSIKMTANTTVYAKWVEGPVGIIGDFVDVPANAYFANAVKWAVENEVTNGKMETLFAPEEACTRAQTVTFLWRAMGSPEPVTKVNDFTDVRESDYCFKAVQWAVENGVTKGMTETTFGPSIECTRAQGLTFLYRALKAQGDNEKTVFTDVPVDAYYAPAVAWAVDAGVINGVSPDKFAPDMVCVRAHMVTFLCRALDK